MISVSDICLLQSLAGWYYSSFHRLSERVFRSVAILQYIHKFPDIPCLKKASLILLPLNVGH